MRAQSADTEPGKLSDSIASPVAQSFATLARALRERGHDAQAVAHFVNQLVFCMLADDVGLLPGQMFTRMLEQARRAPALFVDHAGELFCYARLTGLLDAEPPAFNRAQSTRGRIPDFPEQCVGKDGL